MAVRLFYPEPLEGTNVYPAFKYRYSSVQKSGVLFQDVQYRFFKDAETADVQSADAIVLANNFNRELDEKTTSYLRQQADIAEKLNKPLFIFSSGDFTDKLHFDPRIWVFRYSLYRSSLGLRDISIPTSTEEPPPELIFTQPKNEKPLVAFCGMGGFSSVRRWAAYYAKNLFYDVCALANSSLRARKLGVYWRRAMMRACEHSPLVDTNFIVRSSFSSNAKSIELDPAQARKEYLETTANADFVLAPKGDGNYSNRFLKTLAFGRIPVLVDTDIVLPFESEIDYSKIIVRIPMNRVADTPKLIRAWYDALTPEEWEARQHLARETYETRLRLDSFAEHFFTVTMSGMLKNSPEKSR